MDFNKKIEFFEDIFDVESELSTMDLMGLDAHQQPVLVAALVRAV